MLEVQLGRPFRSSPMAKEITPGTVFFGSLQRDSPMIPHLRLTGGGIVNLVTFQLARVESPETVIYNYEEIADAILTRSSVCSLFDTLHLDTPVFPDVRRKEEQVVIEETKRT